MKKLLITMTLLCAAVGLLVAQTTTPPPYAEDTLAGFREWRFNNSGEERNFKIPVLFNSAEDIAFTFVDSTLEEQLEFESEFPWPPMQSGQRVTIYVSAWGPWVWDRRLDAIDYGNGRLVQAQAGEPVIAGSPTAADSPAVAETPAAADSPAPNPTESRTATIAQNSGSRTGVPQNSGSRTGSPQSPGAGVPVINPSSAEIDSSNEAPADTGFDYGKQPTAPPRQVIVQISGSPPRQGRYYRLQIGSFSVPGNAARAANSLRELGLDPAFEEFGNNIRVVLSRVPGEDVVETARKAGSAGFSEIWCREEP
jgi:hypothetical protein